VSFASCICFAILLVLSARLTARQLKGKMGTVVPSSLTGPASIMRLTAAKVEMSFAKINGEAGEGGRRLQVQSRER
jgi:hypothetical protein